VIEGTSDDVIDNGDFTTNVPTNGRRHQLTNGSASWSLTGQLTRRRVHGHRELCRLHRQPEAGSWKRRHSAGGLRKLDSKRTEIKK
jgi:hypothetical protein